MTLGPTHDSEPIMRLMTLRAWDARPGRWEIRLQKRRTWFAKPSTLYAVSASAHRAFYSVACDVTTAYTQRADRPIYQDCSVVIASDHNPSEQSCQEPTERTFHK